MILTTLTHSLCFGTEEREDIKTTRFVIGLLRQTIPFRCYFEMIRSLSNIDELNPKMSITLRLYKKLSSGMYVMVVFILIWEDINRDSARNSS